MSNYINKQEEANENSGKREQSRQSENETKIH